MRTYRRTVSAQVLRETISEVQRASIETSLVEAERRLAVADLCRDVGDYRSSLVHKRLGLAYLNRACELACVPLSQYYVENSSGIDLAWITYRPEAIPNQRGTDPAALTFLGSIDDLTEDQARSMAIGW